MNNGLDLAKKTVDGVMEQRVLGARRPSNFLAAFIVSLGGIGFALASLSSRIGRNLLPILHVSDLVWIPQGLVMGLYGGAALFLAIYLWSIIIIDLGGGFNRFDKNSGLVSIIRNGYRRKIEVDIPLPEIQAIKVEVREGISPRRRLALKIKGRRDLPLSRIGEPIALADLELSGATLARFLSVPLEGL
jgi:hypothetical protein